MWKMKKLKITFKLNKQEFRSQIFKVSKTKVRDSKHHSEVIKNSLLKPKSNRLKVLLTCLALATIKKEDHFFRIIFFVKHQRQR